MWTEPVVMVVHGGETIDYGHIIIIDNNNRRLVTLAEHTSHHGKQTNSSTNGHIRIYIRIYTPLTITANVKPIRARDSQP